MTEDESAEFFEAYCQVRERFEWLTNLNRDAGVAESKEAVAQVRDFLATWQGKSGDPEVEQGLAQLATWMRGMHRHNELIYVLHVQEVLEKRRIWLVGEHLLKAGVAFIEMMKTAPAPMVPELRRIHRESLGHEFEPERSFRESVENCEEHEAAFLKSLRELEADWPEKLDDALRERLRKADIPEIDPWVEEQKKQARKLQRGSAIKYTKR